RGDPRRGASRDALRPAHLARGLPQDRRGPRDPAGAPVSALLRTAVLGSGAWGTTFAAVLADAGHDVVLWGRDAHVCEQINRAHRNSTYLPGVNLPAQVRARSEERRVGKECRSRRWAYHEQKKRSMI